MSCPGSQKDNHVPTTKEEVNENKIGSVSQKFPVFQDRGQSNRWRGTGAWNSSERVRSRRDLLSSQSTWKMFSDSWEGGQAGDRVIEADKTQ